MQNLFLLGDFTSLLGPIIQVKVRYIFSKVL